MANSIRIPTKLDTDGVKASIKEIEKSINDLKRTYSREVNSFQKEIDKITGALDKSKQKTQEYNDEIKRLTEEQAQAEEELNQASQRQMEARANGTPKEYNEAIRQTQLRQQALDRINQQLDEATQKAQQEADIQTQLNAELEQKNIQLDEYKAGFEQELSEKEIELQEENEKLQLQLEQLQQQKEQLALEKEHEAQIKAHNKGLLKNVRSVKGLVLGIIGARTAYAGIRKIISEVTDDNKQLANTLQGFWGSLGALFAPVINYVIQGLATILNYAMKVIQVLTGVNMLAKAQKSIAKKNGAGSNNGNLASFDKSEVLNKNNGDNSNESYLKDVKLNEDLLKITQAIKGVWDKIVKVTKDWVKTLDFTKLTDSAKSLVSSIAPAIEAIGNYLVYIYEKAILPIAKFAIESAIPFILNSIANALKILTGLINTLLPPLQYLWENIVLPFAERVGEVINGVFEKINEKQALLVKWIDENGEYITTRILEICEMIVEFYNTYIKPIVDIIIDILEVVLNGAIEIALGIVEQFLSNIGDIIDDVEGVLSGLIEFITGVFSGDWEQAWSGIVNTFKNIWNGIIDIVQSVLNGVIAGVNKIIDAINTLSWEIPDWVPGIGGKTFGFNIGHVNGVDLSSWKFNIPKLAQGAVIQPNQPFMAMLGDQRQGRNIEAPEDLIRQIVAEESGSKNITINATGDIGQLIRFLKFELDKEDKRVGTKLVIG